MYEFVYKYKDGPMLFAPKVYTDERGYFMETFNDKEFKEIIGIDTHFVQDNQSCSSRGVLRGMHFQTGESEQAKLVRVVSGSALDVVIDIRKNSPTFGIPYCAHLTAENRNQFFIPGGFAHGFVALKNNTVFQYKCDNHYDKASECCIKWDTIPFDWKKSIYALSPKWNRIRNLNELIISEKDAQGIDFKDFKGV